MKHCGIEISRFGVDQVVNETQGIKHGCLNIRNKWSTREKIWIPEWKGAMCTKILKDEFISIVTYKSLNPV